jgi:hypothetical protein
MKRDKAQFTGGKTSPSGQEDPRMPASWSLSGNSEVLEETKGDLKSVGNECHKDLYCAPRILRADAASKSSPCLPTYQASENLTQIPIFHSKHTKETKDCLFLKLGLLYEPLGRMPGRPAAILGPPF